MIVKESAKSALRKVGKKGIAGGIRACVLSASFLMRLSKQICNAVLRNGSGLVWAVEEEGQRCEG